MPWSHLARSAHSYDSHFFLMTNYMFCVSRVTRQLHMVARKSYDIDSMTCDHVARAFFGRVGLEALVVLVSKAVKKSFYFHRKQILPPLQAVKKSSVLVKKSRKYFPAKRHFA